VTVEALRAPLAALGDGAWVVGGGLRDALMGRPVADIDVAVAGDPEEAARRLSRAHRAGRFRMSQAFGAWRVQGGGLPVAVDLMPLQGGTLEADLARRDLTVNALAVPVTGPPEVVDLHGGLGDLAARRLRAVRADALQADPVRILRVARQAEQLGFAVDPGTVALARAAAPRVWEPAAERIRDELYRIARLPGAWRALEVLDALGGLGALVPQLEESRGLDQSAYHHRDVLGHVLEVVRHACELTADPEPVFRRDAGRLRELLAAPLADDLTRGQALVLSALLHDMAKPATRGELPGGRVTFMGHDRLGAAMADDLLARLRTATRVRRTVVASVREHLRLGFTVHRQPVSVRQVDRYLRATAPAETEQIVLSVADRLATAGPRSAPIQITRHLDLARQVLRIHLALLDRGPIPPPLPGDRLADALGLAPGPWLRGALEAVREEQLTGPVAPARAVAVARRWCRANGVGTGGPAD
jgi:tRNA nucleotidyltransferase/poly(A) polymerase